MINQIMYVFYINDMAIWLDKSTRTGLMLRFQSELILGDTETTFMIILLDILKN